MTTMTDAMQFVRRRSGIVAAVTAAVSFTLGGLGTYYVAHTHPAAPRILLRQATEGDPMASFDGTPGAGGMLILLRNDSAVPVEVIDAAFSRTSAAPPLYIAPETVQPGADVNVFVPIPGRCTVADPATAPNAPPVRILVGAHQPGKPVQSVPVEVVGMLASIMASCSRTSASSDNGTASSSANG